MVLPHNHIVMLDFGACGTTSRRQVELAIELHNRFYDVDVPGAVRVILGVLSPLPNIDVAKLTFEIERTLWKWYLGAWTQDGEWWERTTARLWIAMLGVTRTYQLPVNLEVLRMIRATLLYDTLACRISDRVTFKRAHRQWLKGAAKRARRRLRKEEVKWDRRGRQVYLMAGLARSTRTIRRAGVWARLTSRTLSVEFLALSRKAAHVASAVLSFGLSTLWVLMTGLILVGVYRWTRGHDLDLSCLIWDTITNPVAVTLIVLFFTYAIRRILRRLSDIDPHD